MSRWKRGTDIQEIWVHGWRFLLVSVLYMLLVSSNVLVLQLLIKFIVVQILCFIIYNVYRTIKVAEQRKMSFGLELYLTTVFPQFFSYIHYSLWIGIIAKVYTPKASSTLTFNNLLAFSAYIFVHVYEMDVHWRIHLFDQHGVEHQVRANHESYENSSYTST